MGPQINRPQGSVLFGEYLDVWVVHFKNHDASLSISYSDGFIQMVVR